MESLLTDGFALHPRCSAAAVLRPATGGSFAQLSRPLMRRRSIHLSPTTASRISASATSGTLISKSMQSNRGVYAIGDFMTKKEDLIIVKPSTSVDEALEKLVEHRITGFPVIDDDWTLVGVVSDYDLLALKSISGPIDNLFFITIILTFNEIQKLSSKTNGKTVGELMTPAPLVVRETSNLEAAARLLLETKYRRLPVVDVAGKLIGIITRGNVVRAALQLRNARAKRA
ncbi:hypothetical protein KFK09_026813 [Dendrobium nobile]|uniref:CBS domain-containing protein n=1 Tax=Dendrobium nobile TaxID=94219 RepID=A0A8T3A8K9_DENNO|nr:hypothetical protein KFK09_026813 [Dendrobium nobile]